MVIYLTDKQYRIVTNRDGLLVDVETGIVIDEQPIDLGPDWRSFSEEERIRQTRVGPPLTEMQHGLGLRSYIFGSDSELAKLHSIVSKHGNRWLIKLLRKVNNKCNTINNKVICNDVARFARIIAVKLPSTNRELVVEAALMYAKLLHGDSVRIPHKISRILKRAGLKVRIDSDTIVYNKIRSLVNSLNLSPRVARTSMKIYRVYLYNAKGLVSSKLAAATWISAKLHDINISQTDITDSLNIAESSIRRVLHSVKDKLRVHYFVNGILVEAWQPGRTCFGVYSPADIATMAGISQYNFVVEVPENYTSPIRVLLHTMNNS